MLKIFRKMVRERKDDTTSLYYLFSSRLNRLLQGWASRLQERSERLTPFGKKALLLVFLFVFGGCSIYMGWRAIARPEDIGGIILPENSIIPDTRERPSSVARPEYGLITDREYNRIRAFQHYLDSLGRTAIGKLQVDSLLQRRPGLIDSLGQIERLYLEQHNK